MGMFAEPASAADHAPAGKAAGMIHLDQRLAEHAPGSRLQHLALELGEAQRHRAGQFDRPAERRDRKSTRLTPVTNAHLVCRLLLEKKKKTQKHNTNDRNHNMTHT